MKHTFTAIWCIKAALLLGAVILSACSSPTHETKIVNVANQKWRITALGVHSDKEGWLVSGKLSSPNRFGLPSGRVLISIVDKEGVITKRKEVPYQKVVATNGLHKKHQYGRALFSTHFKSLPQDSAVIAIFEIDGIDEGIHSL